MKKSKLPFLVAVPLFVLCSWSGESPLFGANSEPAAARILKNLAVADGFTVSVWAMEPMLQNPVAFSFDEAGRVYVTESRRRKSSVPDIRKYIERAPDSLKLRTVADRVALFKRMFPEGGKKPTLAHQDFTGDGLFDWRDLGVESEVVHRLEDTDGDGVADKAAVFADGFTGVEAGVAAGVRAERGAVWVGCAPDLWRIDAKTGAKTKLLSGFGVHVAYSGHDVHGLRFGPDGRLYWSVADCGARLTTKEGRDLDATLTGSVFRSEPDGSNVEVYATGLRNPQCLAFNELGDLFTGDNNGDAGDKARWLHLVKGGDYGWRYGWQFLTKLGAYHREGVWREDAAQAHAATLPPVANVGHGPAGIAFYPGTGLPEEFRGTFFYADFPGGIRHFRLEPAGAGYRATTPSAVLQDNSAKLMTGKLLWNLGPSDVQFGVDGGVYVLDWTPTYDKTTKGRIFWVRPKAFPASVADAVAETRGLLKRGFAGEKDAELLGLLGHADQRVRLGAQFALAERPATGAALLAIARDAGRPLLARLHAVWALGQQVRKQPTLSATLVPLLDVEEPEVRAQTARVLGESRVGTAAVPTLAKLLKASEPRVRFFAAEALGELGARDRAGDLIALARENADQDAMIRHACARALAFVADPEALKRNVADSSAAVRTVSVVALRLQKSALVAAYLRDTSPLVLTEAVRAVHDGGIDAALPALAGLATQPVETMPEAARHRVLNAARLVGDGESLGRVAADPTTTPATRLEALNLLAMAGENQTGIDPVMGLPRPAMTATLRREGAATVMVALAPTLLRKPTPEGIRLAAIAAVEKLAVRETLPLLAATVRDETAPGAERASALRAIDAIGSEQLPALVLAALETKEKLLLAQARKLAYRVSTETGTWEAGRALKTGTRAEKQAALAAVAKLQGPDADAILLAQLDALLAGKVEVGIVLDLLESASQRKNPVIAQKLAAYEAQRSSAEVLSRFQECAEGGDAKMGQEVFLENAEAGCFRCHAINGSGGDVGPELGSKDRKLSRLEVLKAIVDPNADLAPGYALVILTLRDGSVVSGSIESESSGELLIRSAADGAQQRVAKADIKERVTAPSAMPPGLGDVLGKRALRDLVEYIATLK